MVTEETADMLAKDALNDEQFQVHMNQPTPHNAQESLACAAKFEDFLLIATTFLQVPYTLYRGEIASRTQAGRSTPSRKRASPDGF